MTYDGVAVGGPRHGVRILSGRPAFRFPTVAVAITGKSNKMPKQQGEYRWDFINEHWVWYEHTNPTNQ